MVALAGLALVFWSRPTGKVVLGLTLALLVVLAAIEFLARPGQGSPRRIHPDRVKTSALGDLILPGVDSLARRAHGEGRP